MKVNISIECMKAAYEKHKNLKLAAEDLGMKWPTLYWHLIKNGVPVVGDKCRYGSESDRFAAKSESDFMKIIPYAENMNRKKYQNKFDFKVNGLKVDLKSSRLKVQNSRTNLRRWAFCIKKQEMIADFIVCFGYKNDEIYLILLIPKEIIRYRSTISVTENSKISKWLDYKITRDELVEFFTKTVISQT